MPGDYHRLSIADKQARHRDRMRAPSVACPECGTQTTAADLIAHVAERCMGQRDPHPGSKWVTWREAIALGVLSGTLTKWVARGSVRARGEVKDRTYLLSDIAVLVAARIANRRRKLPCGSQAIDGRRAS